MWIREPFLAATLLPTSPPMAKAVEVVPATLGANVVIFDCHDGALPTGVAACGPQRRKGSDRIEYSPHPTRAYGSGTTRSEMSHTGNRPAITTEQAQRTTKRRFPMLPESCRGGEPS